MCINHDLLKWNGHKFSLDHNKNTCEECKHLKCRNVLLLVSYTALIKHFGNKLQDDLWVLFFLDLW